MNTPKFDAEPGWVSVAFISHWTGESSWTVRNVHLREGHYKARKSGRRTLIEFASVKAFMSKLPVATFAKPRAVKAR
jgi:hypothetical protein